MPIGISDRIIALFAGLTREEVDMLPPVRRAQFRYWANFADIRPDARKSGYAAFSGCMTLSARVG